MHSDRDLAILDFRKRLPAWREIVNDYSARLDCSGDRWAYHEVHVYCEIASARDRTRLKTLFEDIGLWASRFRFTHELEGEGLSRAAGREELMLGTHFLMPSALSSVLAAELGRIMRALGVREVRTRVERVLGRSTRFCASEARTGWWEAHIAVAAEPEAVAQALIGCKVRDLSTKLDFVSGRPLGASAYVNLEARGASGRQFAQACDYVMETLQARLGLQPCAGLEEVLFDGHTSSESEG
jgi:hypothetical protein